MKSHLATLTAFTALWIVGGTAHADEFTDVLDSARSAYESGDIGVALEELSYASKLLQELKAASLSQLLPAPPDGWTREEVEAGAGAGLAMAFGGGSVASALYTDGSREVTITVVANSPMVSGLGAMITGMSSLSGGKPLRIQRTEFANADGELQGIAGGKVLISVSGDAPLEVKTALLERMDMNALADF